MIGIYGGTFDPIHYGHLRTALEVKQAAQLREVRFVPCRQPPHRAQPQASADQRLAMLRAALASAEPGFVVDTRELDRDGPSYMVDTLSSIRPGVGAEPLALILGLDAFRHLPHWHRWRELFELAHIIVMQRPEAVAEWTPELQTELAERAVDDPGALHHQSAGCVAFVAVTQLAISATAIRTAIASGASGRYLTPDAVLAIIAELEIYKSPRY